MRAEDIHKLCSAELRQAIEANIGRRPEAIALDKRVADAALVATQVKYLQRAESKLPDYFVGRCIIPALSFEQASSQRVAAVKELEGEALLDLTCGLGVDSLHFSHSFKRVVSLERNEMLAAVARENFRRMGRDNVEVICSSAEEYLASCHDDFDWIYADPDRRAEDGKKLVRLEDCSPNILSLRPHIEQVSGGRLMLKNSPLFDVDEAFRLFSPARVEVVSLGDECKEVLVSSSDEDTLVARAVGRGSLEVRREDVRQQFCTQEFDAQEYSHMLIPDVALQKSRLVAHALGDKAHVWSNNGFAFAQGPYEGGLARCFEIEKVVDYSPKSLRGELKSERVQILKRDFAFSTDQIIKQLKIKEGGSRRLAFTTINGRNLVIFLR
ncbi:MAG: SAM-dependent methyltransferase [Rikenellaceae bacterium]